MVYFGKVQNGKVVPDGSMNLPEGSRVRFEPISNGTTPGPSGPDPADSLADLAVNDPSLPTDLAAEHDHYLYGTPKRSGKA